jgi:hypothetical protein
VGSEMCIETGLELLERKNPGESLIAAQGG